MGLTLQSRKTLSDGREIPVLGLGVFQSAKGGETENAVLWAIEAGYRHIDTVTFKQLPGPCIRSFRFIDTDSAGLL